jgi:hypothetical protein
MQSELRMATGWTVRSSNTKGARFSEPVQTGPGGPSSILYNWYRVSVQGVKQPGAWRWPPTPSGAEVKERVELYLCLLSGPSWRVLEWTSTVTELSSLDIHVLNKYSYIRKCLVELPIKSLKIIYVHFWQQFNYPWAKLRETIFRCCAKLL